MARLRSPGRRSPSAPRRPAGEDDAAPPYLWAHCRDSERNEAVGYGYESRSSADTPFGSVLRDDFGDESDVDVLVTFFEDAGWSLMDWADMMEDLRTIFGRGVDLVEKEGLVNPYRRHAILSSAEVLYAA